MEPNDEIALTVAQMLQTKGTWVRDYEVSVSARDYITVNFSVITTTEAIQELHQSINKPMNKIQTQAAALHAVKQHDIIVGSFDSNGFFSAAQNPSVHTTVAEARTEAKRLARLSPGKAFVILTLTGAEMVPNSTLSI